MCGIGACAASCAGSFCASCACSGCAKLCNIKTSTAARIPYLVIMFLGTVLALVVRYWGKEWVVSLYWFSVNLCSSAECVGFPAAYRVSFTLFFFFFIHAVFMVGNCLKFHSQYWVWKVLILLGTLILAFIIPNAFFDVYSIISRIVSGFFLLLQIIILIDFAYRWNEDWVSDEKQWYVPVLVSAFILYGGSYTLIAFMFDWFDNGNCPRNQFFMVFTILTTFIVTVISITKWCKHGAILPSGVVTLYSTYLCYSALRSDPGSCNQFRDSEDTAQVVISIVIAASTICYAGWNLSNSSSIFGFDPDDEVPEPHRDRDEEAPAAPKPDSASEGEKKDPKEDPKEEDDPEDHMDESKREFTRKRNLKFHIVMAAASMYLAMLITNWGVETSSSSQAYDLGDVSVYVKMVSQWVTLLLYFWTLVAPYLFPDRDFGVDMRD